jgi:hypothetical protein
VLASSTPPQLWVCSAAGRRRGRCHRLTEVVEVQRRGGCGTAAQQGSADRHGEMLQSSGRETSNGMYGHVSRAGTSVSASSRVTYDVALERMRELSGSGSCRATRKPAVVRHDPLVQLTQQVANAPGTPRTGKSGRRSASSARGTPSNRPASAARSGSTTARPAQQQRDVEDRSEAILARIQ